MMTEKVKISREQEKLINKRISYYKQQGLNQNQIVSSVFDDKKSRGFFEGTSFHSMGTFDFMKILIGNYEVEQTPEEKILAEYNWRKPLDCSVEGVMFREGMKFVLNAYNIQIKGVNA